jgi:D-arabinose 1-dehydrogenase-like Zn-dependent alcohol dehydrogenase
MSRLLGSTAAGGYAEYVVVPETAAIPLSATIAPPAGALTVCPIGTSVRAMMGIAAIGPGDVVVITGAGGGLGFHQVQVAAAMGARPIAVTGSPDKREALVGRGAEVVIMEPAKRLRHAIRDVIGPDGADAVIENVTSSTLAETIWTVRQGGIVVVLGNVDVVDVPINPGLLIERRLRVVGSGNPTHEDVRRSLSLVASGMVQPEIGAVIPFAHAAEAHRLAESRAVLGRVVLSGW